MDAHPDHLDIAIARTDQVIAAISDDQLSLATPCADWDVLALLEHVISGNRAFAAALRGDAEIVAAARPESAAVLLETYRDSAADVSAGFRLEGALAAMVTVPFGTVPGAALADLPPDRRPFGPAQPVAEDAPAIDRLAACLGRAVGTE